MKQVSMQRYRKFEEDPNRCVWRVWPRHERNEVQCSRRRGYGPRANYCTQHAKIFEEHYREKTKSS